MVVKADRDVETESGKGKRDAALTWANHVNGSKATKTEWAYLLVTETDLVTAMESWSSLVRLASRKS